MLPGLSNHQNFETLWFGWEARQENRNITELLGATSQFRVDLEVRPCMPWLLMWCQQSTHVQLTMTPKPAQMLVKAKYSEGMAATFVEEDRGPEHEKHASADAARADLVSRQRDVAEP